MVAITAATGGAYVLQGMKERFGFEQRLVNCVFAFWCVPAVSSGTAGQPCVPFPPRTQPDQHLILV